MLETIERTRFTGSYRQAKQLCRECPDVFPSEDNRWFAWDGKLRVLALDGWQVAEPGDWIVTGPKGDRYVERRR